MLEPIVLLAIVLDWFVEAYLVASALLLAYHFIALPYDAWVYWRAKWAEPKELEAPGLTVREEICAWWHLRRWQLRFKPLTYHFTYHLDGLELSPEDAQAYLIRYACEETP